MAEFGNFFSRLFSAGSTKGLSGAGNVLPDEPALRFFNEGLRKHHVDTDFIKDPSWIWTPSGYSKGNRTGLLGHLLTEKEKEEAGFSDILVIVNQADWSRAPQIDGQPWDHAAAAALEATVDAMLEEEDYPLPFPQRAVNVMLLQDGSAELGEHSLGLKAGEFVTCLVPNVYAGKSENSKGLVGVHINIPRQWQGYREVGRLYDDQLVFTIGNHFLDSFSHPSLGHPALYRLQHQPDGSFIHIINPSLEDQYKISSSGGDAGPSILSVKGPDGRSVCHMILAIITAEDDQSPLGSHEILGGVDDEARPRIDMPPPPAAQKKLPTPGGTAEEFVVEFGPSRSSAAPATEHPVSKPSIGIGVAAPPAPTPEPRPSLEPSPTAPPPAAPKAAGPSRTPMEQRAMHTGPVPQLKAPGPAPSAFEEGAAPAIPAGLSSSKTVIPEIFDQRMFTLHEQGALLQKVHFSNVMEGYDVYVGQSGEVATSMANPAATFQIRRNIVALLAHDPRIHLNGKRIPTGHPIRLKGDVMVQLPGKEVRYTDLSRVRVPGWPYLGEIRRTGGSVMMVFGGNYKIGRDRRARVRLPDEPANDNIVWLPGLAAGTTIRSQTGEIPKSRFYTDSIMVASDHAEIDLSGDPVLISHARHCYTYVRRGQKVFPLFPTQGRNQGPLKHRIEPGDDILIGNCVFAVSFPPVGGATAPQPGPLAAPINASSLAEAADDWDRDSRIEEPATPARPSPPAAPAPAPLGQAATAPEASSLSRSQDLSLAARPSPRAQAPSPPPQPPVPETPRIAAPMLMQTWHGGEDLSSLDLPGERIPRPAVDENETLTDPLSASRTPPPASPLAAEPEPAWPEAPPASTAEALQAAEPPMHQLPPDDDLEPLGFLLGPPPDQMPDPTALPSGPSAISAGISPAPDARDPFRAKDFQPTPELVQRAQVTTQPPRGAGAPPREDDVAPTEEAPRPTPPVAALSDSADDAGPVVIGAVLAVDEEDSQTDLSRPGRITLVGWMVVGKMSVGNHLGAEIVVPENRVDPEQSFAPHTYAEFFVRGRRGRTTLLAAEEARLYQGPTQVEEASLAPDLRLVILRRDPDGEPDFEVKLAFDFDQAMPNPRARLLLSDTSDPVAQALFVRGLPLRAERTLQLDAIELSALFDGNAVILSHYLATYRRDDGSFVPFFVAPHGGGFQTAPEDGSDIILSPGDRFIIGQSVFEFSRV